MRWLTWALVPFTHSEHQEPLWAAVSAAVLCQSPSGTVHGFQTKQMLCRRDNLSQWFLPSYWCTCPEIIHLAVPEGPGRLQRSSVFMEGLWAVLVRKCH